jgi:hypothetical protein
LRFIVHINTKHGKPIGLHTSVSKLTKLKKGTFCFGIKVFNYLPSRVDSLSPEEKQVRLAFENVSSYELILYVGSMF